MLWYATNLDIDQRVRLIELLREQREGVSNGTIVGYGQDREDELFEIDQLIELLNAPPR
jgi:hypothetical protein